jgi:hypothetical protein
MGLVSIEEPQVLRFAQDDKRSSDLVAEAGADGDLVTALGAAAGKNSGATLGLHARAETMGLGTVTAVRLKCALGHGTALLIVYRKMCQCGKSSV